MKLIRIAKNEKEKMQDWFDKRTKQHIEGVQKYCKKVEEFDPERFKGLIEQGSTHDASKYKDPEVDPYLYISWQYKCKDDGIDYEPPEDMEEKMSKATEHHVKNNRHHPEFHSDEDADFINREDRDKPPEKMVDATKMKVVDVAEMAADWMAMSEEKGGTPKGWADKNVNVRWKFSDDQKDLIYELIKEIWE